MAWEFAPTSFSSTEYTTGTQTAIDEWPPAGGGTGERLQTGNVANGVTRTGTVGFNLTGMDATDRGLMMVMAHTGTAGDGEWSVSAQLKVNNVNQGSAVVRTSASTSTYRWNFFHWPSSVMAAVAANPSLVTVTFTSTNLTGASGNHRVDVIRMYVSPLSSVPSVTGITMADVIAAWDFKAAMSVKSDLWSDGGTVDAIPDIIGATHMLRQTTNTGVYVASPAGVTCNTTRWVTVFDQDYTDAWFVGVVDTGATAPTGDADSRAVMSGTTLGYLLPSETDGGFNPVLPAWAAASDSGVSWIHMCGPTGAASDHIRATNANGPTTNTAYCYLGQLASAANERFWRKASGEITSADKILDAQAPSGTVKLRSISWGSRSDNTRHWIGKLRALWVFKSSVSEATALDYAQAIGVYHGVLANPSISVVFDPVTVSHAAEDFTAVASGSAPLIFDMAASGHAAADLNVIGGGTVPLAFDAAATVHAAEEMALSADTPAQSLAFDPAASGHTAPGGVAGWSHHSSGIAAAADPTTVNFGYTASAGQLLYFYAVGGMTQVTPSGWTKIAPAVGDMEAALFYKTAAGGETSITVDHNGPRVMGWAFWAFPSGSTHQTNTQTVSTSDSITLSGLPGTAVTVLALYARVVGYPITSLTASSVWSGGVTELYDLGQAGTGVTGGDGIYHTAAYVNGYTSTSITPAVAITAGGITNSNRYWIVAAVSVPAVVDGFVVRASGGADIPFDGAASLHAATDVTVRASGAADVPFAPVASGHTATDFTPASAGGAQVPFDPVASGHAATDPTVRASGGADIPFDPAASGHAAADTTLRASGGADIPFVPAASGHAAADTVTRGSGGADIPFPAVGSGHAAGNTTVKGSGGVDLPFAPVGSGHAAQSVTVRAAGAADIIFSPVGTTHLGLDFDARRVGGNSVVLDPAISGHHAVDFSLVGGGTVLLAFAPAGSGHQAGSLTVRGSGAAVLPFDSATSRHLAADFLARASGGATLLFDPALTGHAAGEFIVVGVAPGIVPVVTAGAGNVPIQWKDANGDWQTVITNL